MEFKKSMCDTKHTTHSVYWFPTYFILIYDLLICQLRDEQYFFGTDELSYKPFKKTSIKFKLILSLL